MFAATATTISARKCRANLCESLRPPGCEPRGADGPVAFGLRDEQSAGYLRRFPTLPVSFVRCQVSHQEPR